MMTKSALQIANELLTSPKLPKALTGAVAS